MKDRCFNVLRVMQINLNDKFGGVSSMIYNIYLNIDRDKVQFDFVAPKTSSFHIFRDEIEKKGGNIFELNATGILPIRKAKFIKRLYSHIKSHHYKVIHINSGSIFFNIQCAWVAKICGIKKIIVHSHNAGTDSILREKMMKMARVLLEIFPTVYLACSEKAAEYMYVKWRISGGEYTIIKNGIDVNKFRYCEKNREQYRKMLGIDDRLVLLHVGRFTLQKNHTCLIKIFAECLKWNSRAVLLLVGEGELLEATKAEVEDLGLKDTVIFFGIRQDIPEIMSASDVFLLPSLYEGLPVVGVEAQASGLPCVFSDTITREADINEKNYFISNKDIQAWVEAIRKCSLQKNNRMESADVISRKGYSLETIAKELQEIYLSN